MREPGEVILTMRPLVCRLIISLATPKVSATRPVTLTAKVRCQSASDMLLKASASPIAAQFTKMSMRPNCLTVSCTICAVLPEEVRSAGIDSSGPACDAHSACALTRPARSMSTSTTDNPRFASAAESSRPSPAAAPVTTAHLGSFIGLQPYGSEHACTKPQRRRPALHPFLRFDQLCPPNLAVTEASTVLGAPTVMVLK